MNNKQKPNILFLPSWYPNRDDKMLGLFTFKHADALKSKTNLLVLSFVESSKNKKRFEIESSSENGFIELLIYIKKNNFPFLSRIIYLINFITAIFIAHKIIKNIDFQADLCHIHTASSIGLYALFLKYFKGIEYVITEHWSRYLKGNENFKGVFTKFYIRFLVKKAKIMSTVSNYLKEAMQSHNINNKNWEIIPNIVSHKKFRPIDIKRKSDRCRIFHISCFEDKSKNISGILQAISNLLKNRDDFELVLIGDGIDFKKLQNYALNELKIPSDNIEFLGELEESELINTINGCDFSILFSNYETFGIVIAESLACEKPVIGSDGGAIPEILPEKFGKIVKKQNIKELEKTIDFMIDNHDKFPKEEMRDYVIENYSDNIVAPQILDLYTKALNNV